MENKKTIYGGIILLLITAIVLFFIIFNSFSKEVRVIFLDVGQGDAILISNGSKQLLIDGGNSGGKLLEKIGRYVPFWDRTIEVVLATHPDGDHIGGLLNVISKYNVQAVIETDAQSNSKLFNAWEEKIAKMDIEKVGGYEGLRIVLNDTASMKILLPDVNNIVNSDDTNSKSIVSQLETGMDKIFFTGDMTRENESLMLEKEIDIRSAILKVAHHGSRSSSSEAFVQKVAPRNAIISVGRHNTYGHPHGEIINMLEGNNIKILRTDTEGDIVFSCSAEKICQQET